MSERNRKRWRGEGREGKGVVGISRGTSAPRYRRSRQVSGLKRSGNIGERLVDHRLGRFHGSGYACHQKRRSGKASDVTQIGPTCFLGWKTSQKKGKNRGKRESERVKRIGHEREENGMGYLLSKGETIRDLSNSVPAAPRS
jgi:hypothetical protein